MPSGGNVFRRRRQRALPSGLPQLFREKVDSKLHLACGRDEGVTAAAQVSDETSCILHLQT